jgi:hypothetical protein
MATQDGKPDTQPTEDMYGREDDPRNEQAHWAQPARAEQCTPHAASPEACLKEAEEEAERERSFGGVGELPDGDGVRSDLGTNPLPEVYWSAFPDKPDGGR